MMNKKDLWKEVKADLKAGKQMMIVTIENETQTGRTVKVRNYGDIDHLKVVTEEALNIPQGIEAESKSDYENRLAIIRDIQKGKDFYAITVEKRGNGIVAQNAGSISQRDLFTTLSNLLEKDEFLRSALLPAVERYAKKRLPKLEKEIQKDMEDFMSEIIKSINKK